MKKTIYISVIFIVLVSSGLFFLIPKEKQLEKVVIQTQLVQIKIVEAGKLGLPEVIRTKWIHLNKDKTKDISFFTDAATLDGILSNLNLTNNLYSNSVYYGKKILYGGEKKFTWLVVKNENTTYLKLISPSGEDTDEQKGGC